MKTRKWKSFLCWNNRVCLCPMIYQSKLIFSLQLGLQLPWFSFDGESCEAGLHSSSHGFFYDTSMHKADSSCWFQWQDLNYFLSRACWKRTEPSTDVHQNFRPLSIIFFGKRFGSVSFYQHRIYDSNIEKNYHQSHLSLVTLEIQNHLVGLMIALNNKKERREEKHLIKQMHLAKNDYLLQLFRYKNGKL